MGKKFKRNLLIQILLIILIVIFIGFFIFKLAIREYDKKYRDLNIKSVLKIKEDFQNKDEFSFAVIGEINNNALVINDFQKLLKENGTDFIVSTGNIVSLNIQSNYHKFFKILDKLSYPFCTAIGSNELEKKDNDYKNFRKYFGPEVYHFTLKSSLFVFLNTVNLSLDEYQRYYLEDVLKQYGKLPNKFIIMNQPLFPMDTDDPILKMFFELKTNSKLDQKESNYFLNLSDKYHITEVFSGGYPIFSTFNYFNNSKFPAVSAFNENENKKQETEYIVTGGGGNSLYLDSQSSFYHFVLVHVGKAGVSVKPVRLNPEKLSFLQRLVKNLGGYFYSYLYINIFPILVVFLILFLAGSIIYLLLSKNVDYYRNFMQDYESLPKKSKYIIAMITDAYFPFVGGVPVSIRLQSETLRKLGHTVYIIAPEYVRSKNKTPYFESEFLIRIPLFFYLRKKPILSPAANIFTSGITDLVKKLNIDVIHTHHPFWLGLKGNFVARNLRLPVVYTYHTRLEEYRHNLPGLVREILGNKITHWFVRYYCQRCDAIFSPTADVKKYLRMIGVSKEIFVQPTGIEISHFIQVDRAAVERLSSSLNLYNSLILFSCSRLDKEKNIYFMLKGILKLKEYFHEPFKLLIAGDGPEKSRIKEFIKAHNLTDVVLLLGNINSDELPLYYHLGNIFIFSSKSETQGIVLLEAMACSLPVIAIKSSGINDLIEEGYNGFKTEDSPDMWVESILKLMQNPQLREKMALHAFEFAKEFDVNKTVSKMVSIYERLYQRKIFVENISVEGEKNKL